VEISDCEAGNSCAEHVLFETSVGENQRDKNIVAIATVEWYTDLHVAHQEIEHSGWTLCCRTSQVEGAKSKLCNFRAEIHIIKQHRI